MLESPTFRGVFLEVRDAKQWTAMFPDMLVAGLAIIKLNCAQMANEFISLAVYTASALTFVKHTL